MLERVRLVQGIGKFEHVSAANIELSPLTLAYAENGRGKTTLVAIFRSLATGDPLPLAERKRLGSTNSIQVALAFSDESNAIVFQNGAWSTAKPNIVVFDEQFINENVYSGLVVQSPQREGLHGLIVGAQGVALLRALQTEVEAIETHNQRLRSLSAAISPKILRGLTVDQFCDLPEVPDIEARIEEARKSVSAAQQQESIVRVRDLVELSVAYIPPSSIEELLNEQVPEISAEAERRVAKHVEKLGAGGESWLAQGNRIHIEHNGELQDSCPYCAQPLAPSALANAYAHHFSASYNDLKAKIQRTIARVDELLGSSVTERLHLNYDENSTKALFWNEFAEIQQPTFNINGYIEAVRAVRDGLTGCLQRKAASPLEPMSLDEAVSAAIRELSDRQQEAYGYNQIVKDINAKAAVVKEAISVASVGSLRDELNRLEASQDRQAANTAGKCDAYLTEKAAKKTTESRRASKKRALDAHLQNAFPAFQDAINLHLRRLNAGFRIDGVRSLNTRKGPSCIYSVVIDSSPDHPVAVNEEAVGVPTFKTVLSTSDRNTLALAVFLASVSQMPSRDAVIAVIDDPINSLDEHRAFATVSEIRRLAAEVNQVIILSHSRSLVCHLWESPGQIGRTAIEVARAGDSSTIKMWDVSTHGITEHDKRHSKLRRYLDSNVQNPREVAEAIRPTMEAFLRVAYPEHFPPGTLLGPFKHVCSQHVNKPTEILNAHDVEELSVLTEYGNRFHHDTNPAWQTADINDAELLGFVRRTVRFTKRA